MAKISRGGEIIFDNSPKIEKSPDKTEIKKKKPKKGAK